MARATGRDAEKYEAMAALAKQYILDKFLNVDGEFKTAIFNTMQTPALFALKNKLVEGVAKENMMKRLRDNFAEHGNCHARRSCHAVVSSCSPWLPLRPACSSRRIGQASAWY